jgi:hypothetical protein
MTGDLEKESRDHTLDHLTEDKKAAYCEQQVEGTRRAHVEMHLKGSGLNIQNSCGSMAGEPVGRIGTASNLHGLHDA